MILSIRTDKPEAELGLYTPEGQEVEYFTWEANRELSKTILTEIKNLLGRHEKDFPTLTGLVVFEGPGSFTGLRIGITVANTMAYSLEKPIVGVMGNNWQQAGIARLKQGENDRIVLPHYGAEAHITLPKK